MSVQQRRRPKLFIVGAPKSGTTSLYEYLNGHPDIYMSPIKEPAYFSPDVPPQKPRFRYGVDLDRYLDLFAAARDERCLGEASTYYLYSRMAPELIRDFEPEARIVAILRNPIEMAWALHGQRVAHGREPIDDFESALAADESDDLGGPARHAEIDKIGTYRQRARYAEQLSRWFDTFGRQRCHVIIFEEFVADTAGEFRRLLEFLGVDLDYAPQSFEIHNPSHRVRRGIARSAMSSRPGRFVAQRLMPGLIGFERAARLAKRLRGSELTRVRADRQPISAALRRQLEAELRPDVARLSEMLSRDMESFWFKRSAVEERHPADAGVR